MLKIVILDDESSQTSYIESVINTTLLQETDIRKYHDVDSFLKNLDNFTNYTIFILDIILQKHNGIDLAKVVNEYLGHPIIIFVSGYLNKATEVYDTEHCYFIYKPELEKRLPQAINKATKLLEELKTSLTIQQKDGIVLVPIKDIIYLERNKRTTIIKGYQETITCSYKLEYLLPLLSSSFIQCHRSYVVNLNAVKKYTVSIFSMVDGTNISISRSHQHMTKEKWHLYLKNRL